MLPPSTSVLSSITMSGARPRHRPRVFGSLAVALLLHGLGLALAACFGFRTIVPAQDSFETFALSWRPKLAEEAEVESGETAGEEVLTELLVLEPLPEALLLETSFLEPSAPIVLAPLLVDAIEPEPSDVVADAPDSPAPCPDSEPVPGAGASAPGLGVGAQAGGVPIALRPRRATAWSPVLGDMRAQSEMAPVGPRPVQGQAAVAAAPRAQTVREPRPVETPRPPYPGLSVRAGEEGSVLCRLHIDAAGAVTQVAVVESSGFERLDQAARTTLLAWRFEPRRHDGRSVATTLLHRVTFRLES